MSIPKKTHPFLFSAVSPWLFVFIIVSLGCLYFFSLRPGHDWGDDFAAYILHAKNIVGGRAYSDIGFIQNPFNRIAPEAYPPVFPFLLSTVYRLFGMNLLAMKTMVILFWVGALWLMYIFLRSRLTGIFLVLFLLTVGLHPFLTFFLNNILSESTFLFFVLLSLCLAQHLDKDSLSVREKIFVSAGLGFAMSLAYGTRAIGIVLIPAVIMYDLTRRRRLSREATIAILICLFLVSVQMFFMSAKTSSFYFSFLKPQVVLERGIFYLTNFYFFNVTMTQQFFFLIKLCLGLIGFYAALRKKCSPVEFFTLFYIPIILIFNKPPTLFEVVRFFIPMLPFYFYYVFFGVQEMVLNKKIMPMLGAIVFVVIALLQVGPAIAVDRHSDFKNVGVATREARDLFRYIAKNTQPDDVFIFIKPRALTLFTDRPASVYYAHKNMGDFWAYARKINARYIVIFKGADAYLKYVVESCPGKTEKFYENSGFQVFKIK